MATFFDDIESMYDKNSEFLLALQHNRSAGAVFLEFTPNLRIALDDKDPLSLEQLLLLLRAPIQRIGKYQAALKALLDNSEPSDAQPDISDINSLIKGGGQKSRLMLETPYHKFIKNGNMDKEKDSLNSTHEDSKETPGLGATPSAMSIRLDVGAAGTAGATSAVEQDYSDSSDLRHITSLFGRKSRTKLSADASGSMSASLGEDNEVDVVVACSLLQLKVHNSLPIDSAVQVRDVRILLVRYEHKALDMHSSVKSFIVIAEKEWAAEKDSLKNTHKLKLHKLDSDSDEQHNASKPLGIGIGIGIFPLPEVETPRTLELTVDADVAISPYYEDTPPMDGKGELHFGGFATTSLELQPANSLNLGATLDAAKAQMELDQHQQQQQQRHELKDAEEERYEAARPNDRESSLLRAIPENSDTDDEMLANDTDAATALEHKRNMSTHSHGSALSTDCDPHSHSASDSELEYLDHEDGGVDAGTGTGMRSSLNLKSANSSALVAVLVAALCLLARADVSQAQVAISRHGTCFIQQNQVACWGDNQWGQLGVGNTDTIGDKASDIGLILYPIDLGDDFDMKQMAGGGKDHYCMCCMYYILQCTALSPKGAVSVDGRLKCWGWNADGMSVAQHS